MRASKAVCLCLAYVLPSCGTDLLIRQEDRGIASPDGIVVNHRRAYSADIHLTIPGLIPADARAKLSGISHDSVLVVNMSRLPFGNADIVLKLSDKQVMRDVKVVSKSGAEGAANASKAVVEAMGEHDDDN